MSDLEEKYCAVWHLVLVIDQQVPTVVEDLYENEAEADGVDDEDLAI